MNVLRGRNLDTQVEKNNLEIQAFIKDFDHVYAHCSHALKIHISSYFAYHTHKKHISYIYRHNIFKNKKDIKKSFGTHILEGLNYNKMQKILE